MKRRTIMSPDKMNGMNIQVMDKTSDLVRITKFIP